MSAQNPPLGEAEFAAAVFRIARMFNANIDEFAIEFFCDAARPYGWDRCLQALKELTLKTNRFPSVGDFLDVVNPNPADKLSEADDSAAIVGRIEEAMTKYGRNAHAKVREFIGELGWAVVGGRWTHLCDSTTYDDLPTLKAQWRMEIRGTAARLKAGLTLAPGLPSDNEALPPVVQAALDTLNRKELGKKLPEKK